MLKYSIAALALVATSTFALADPNNGGPGAGGAGPGGGAGGAAMEHSGGAPGGAMKGEGGPSLKGDSSPSKSFSGGEMKSGRNEGKEGSRKSMDKAESSADRKTEKNSENQLNDKENARQHNRQAEDYDRSGKREDRAERSDRKDRMRSDEAKDNSRADRGATGASEGAEGKARAKGSLTNLSTEQKTRVRHAFRDHRVAPAHIGRSVNIGVVIPRSVEIYPVPSAIIAIAPDYRGYDYFWIDETHVAVVDPDTLEVVDVLVVA